ncbi:hypothetical protein AN958_01910 [Leucoagaricus sp. SymC.cos]|nr:hypothetical protein AN958_01910 [Leucoagaricus sp. SymC.cos]
MNTVLHWLSDYVMKGAEFDSSERDPPPRCHPGTRTNILERTQQWFDDPNRETKLQWIRGPAGVGKSAIVQTFVESPAQKKRLGASLFFSRPNGRTNPKQIFPTLAYQFATRNRLYKAYLNEIMQDDPHSLEKAMGEQFRILIIEPFTQLKLGDHLGEVLVAIDGLDECGGDPNPDNPIQSLHGRRTSEEYHCEILHLINDFVRDNPTAPLIWIIASRPEAHIQAVFSKADVKNSYMEEDIPADSEEACRDVEAFLNASFTEIRNAFPPPIIEGRWPSNCDFLQIANAARGLFVFAQVVIRFIADTRVGNPIGQLRYVLTALSNLGPLDNHRENPFAVLDAIYTAILFNVPLQVLDNTKQILQIAFYHTRRGVSSEEVNFKGIYTYLGLSREDAIAALRPLHSVICFRKDRPIDRSRPYFYHASFRDYLEDPSRSGAYSIPSSWKFDGRILWERYFPYKTPMTAEGILGHPSWSKDNGYDLLAKIIRNDKLSSSGVPVDFLSASCYIPDEELQVLLTRLSFAQMMRDNMEFCLIVLKEQFKQKQELKRRGILLLNSLESLNISLSALKNAFVFVDRNYILVDFGRPATQGNMPYGANDCAIRFHTALADLISRAPRTRDTSRPQNPTMFIPRAGRRSNEASLRTAASCNPTEQSSGFQGVQDNCDVPLQNYHNTDFGTLRHPGYSRPDTAPASQSAPMGAVGASAAQRPALNSWAERPSHPPITPQPSPPAPIPPRFYYTGFPPSTEADNRNVLAGSPIPQPPFLSQHPNWKPQFVWPQSHHAQGFQPSLQVAHTLDPSYEFGLLPHPQGALTPYQYAPFGPPPPHYSGVHTPQSHPFQDYSYPIRPYAPMQPTYTPDLPAHGVYFNQTNRIDHSYSHAVTPSDLDTARPSSHRLSPSMAEFDPDLSRGESNMRRVDSLSSFSGDDTTMTDLHVSSRASPDSRSGSTITPRHDFTARLNSSRGDAQTQSGRIEVLHWLSDYVMKGAEFDSSERDPPPRCHPGTRTNILERTQQWFDDPNRETKLQWIRGPAGVGKSAIVQTFVESPAQKKRLGASLFFSRPNGRTNPKQIFPTLAYQFATRNRLYKAYLNEIMQDDPHSLEKAMGEQFRILIIEPFTQLKLGDHLGEVLVAIDGLDECGGDPNPDNPIQSLHGRRTSEEYHCEILHLINDFVRDNPTAPLIWIIASRPEAHIQAVFSKADVKNSYMEEDIPADSEEACRDVEAFLNASFTEIRNAFPPPIIEGRWPSNCDFLQIANAARGLFVFAQVVIRFIADTRVGNPIGQLRYVLTALSNLGPLDNHRENPFAVLDAIYTAILFNVPLQVLDNTKQILQIAFYHTRRGVSSEEVNFKGIYTYLGLSREDAIAALRPLHSVICFRKDRPIDRSRPYFYHASFRDYLEDPSRSGAYSIPSSWKFDGRILWERYFPYKTPMTAEGILGHPSWSKDNGYDLLAKIIRNDKLSSSGVPVDFLSASCYIPDEELQVLLTRLSFAQMMRDNMEFCLIVLKEQFKQKQELKRRGILLLNSLESLNISLSALKNAFVFVDRNYILVDFGRPATQGNMPYGANDCAIRFHTALADLISRAPRTRVTIWGFHAKERSAVVQDLPYFWPKIKIDQAPLIKCGHCFACTLDVPEPPVPRMPTDREVEEYVKFYCETAHALQVQELQGLALQEVREREQQEAQERQLRELREALKKSGKKQHKIQQLLREHELEMRGKQEERLRGQVLEDEFVRCQVLREHSMFMRTILTQDSLQGQQWPGELQGRLGKLQQRILKLRRRMVKLQQQLEREEQRSKRELSGLTRELLKREVSERARELQGLERELQERELQEPEPERGVRELKRELQDLEREMDPDYQEAIVELRLQKQVQELQGSALQAPMRWLEEVLVLQNLREEYHLVQMWELNQKLKELELRGREQELQRQEQKLQGLDRRLEEVSAELKIHAGIPEQVKEGLAKQAVRRRELELELQTRKGEKAELERKLQVEVVRKRLLREQLESMRWEREQPEREYFQKLLEKCRFPQAVCFVGF